MNIAYLSIWIFQDGVTKAKFFQHREDVDNFIFGFGGEFERSFKDDLGHVSVYKLNYGKYQGTAQVRTLMESK